MARGPVGGRDDSALSDLLFAEGHRFEFFQAVRILSSLGRQHSESDDSSRWPVGEDHFPERETVRFRAWPSLSFAAGQVVEIRQPLPDANADPPQSPPPEMTVSFWGLTGPHGVLPQHYTTLLLSRLRVRDNALRDFFDLFTHRSLSLFYRAWEKYRFYLGYERVRTNPAGAQEDLFTACLYCLVGLGAGGLRHRVSVDDETFLYYGGLFAQRPRSAIALEQMLADYFQLPVQVIQFQGQWLQLSAEDLSRTAGPGGSSGQNMQLGRTLVIGERVWDVECKFRVRVGPLSYRQFQRFMPLADLLTPLIDMARCYVGPHFDFDVQPVLKAKEVPACRLGGPAASGARLGWNTWPHSQPFAHDADDAVFS